MEGVILLHLLLLGGSLFHTELEFKVLEEANKRTNFDNTSKFALTTSSLQSGREL
jgi:hypothetical protein